MASVTKPRVERTRPDELVSLALQGKIRIPRFQRPFRWDKRDIEALFDSIYRGYPIGNLLMWARPATETSIEIGALRISVPDVDDALWVVDGQQRITALVSALIKYAGASYAGIGRVIKALTPSDFTEYIHRLAAMVVMGNTDGHLKNWTLRYPDSRSPLLSPAYDFVSITAYPGFKDDTLAFDLGGSRAAHAAGSIWRHFTITVSSAAANAFVVIRREMIDHSAATPSRVILIDVVIADP
jgi:hypothetical protein